MANRIQLRRGIKSKLPTLTQGEPAFVTDTRELFIGTGSGNVNIGGSMWYKGTDMSGTSTAVNTYSYNACPLVKVGDTYLNTSNGNVYECTTTGSGTGAKWTYKGNIKGASGKDATQDSVIKWWLESMVKTCIENYDASTEKLISSYAKTHKTTFGWRGEPNPDGSITDKSSTILYLEWNEYGMTDGEIVYLPAYDANYEYIDVEHMEKYTLKNIKGTHVQVVPNSEAVIYFSKNDKLAYLLWQSKE